MTDFLDEKRQEIRARLKELQPLVDEFQRLEAAATALDGVGSNGATATATTTRRAPGRPRKAASRKTAAPSTGKRRRGRPRGSGTRGTEALNLVKASPGITIPELAEKMGIKQNYLYRVLPGLAQDGLVEKRGREWHPKEAA